MEWESRAPSVSFTLGKISTNFLTMSTIRWTCLVLLCSLFQLYIVSVQTETRHLCELYITNAEFWKVAVNPPKAPCRVSMSLIISEKKKGFGERKKSKKFSNPPACLLYFVVCVGSRQTHSQHQRSCEVQSRPGDSNSNIHEVIPLPRALRGETAFMRLHPHHENTQPTLKNHMLNEPAHTHTPPHTHPEKALESSEHLNLCQEVSRFRSLSLPNDIYDL